MAQEQEQVTYVYGVVRTGTSRGMSAHGIGGAPVLDVVHEELAALVSHVPAPVRAKRAALLGHSEVLNEAVATGPVLPLRFGTTFPDADTVVSDFLRPRRSELRKLLDDVERRVELTVKAFYRSEVILAEIVQSNKRVAQLREATRDRPPVAAHGALLELGTAVAAELQARSQADASAILEELRPLAVDISVGEPQLEHQLLAASLLVERRDVPALDRAMDEIARRHAGRIEFKYVGPLAPHSFVSLSPTGSH